MTRWLVGALCALALLSGCKRAAENKDAVRQGIEEHLRKNAALDMSQLTVDVTGVRFSGDEALADVAIRPKSAPDQGMTMSYTLVRKADKWEVKGKGAGHGGADAATTPTPDPGAPLPPGHPPVAQPPAASK